MPIKKLESTIGKQNSTKIIEEVETSIGVIKSLEQVSGGIVHYVYKIVSDTQTAYLKIRSDHYSGIPNIPTQPELIVNEKRAIELFSDNSAKYFPNILAYNDMLHFLLLSDVMPEGVTLDRKYQKDAVTTKDIYQIGKAIGTIHQSTQTTEPVRMPNDKHYQENLMLYALEMYEHPVLITAANEHKERETQLLIGDLSPKNEYVERDIVRMCDLENAHQGALPYDQAFMIAHVLLHHPARNIAITAMWSLIDGYKSAGSTIDHNDSLLAQTLHGILLYRLDNPVIPYELPINSKTRKKMTKNVFSSLDENSKDIEVVAANLFKK